MSTYNMEKQHKLGKLHALERICMLLDEDSFREIGSNTGKSSRTISTTTFSNRT